jgi:hypothetical protein
MNLPNTQSSTQSLDLYDQDHYSIPDDDLRSDLSANSFVDDDDDDDDAESTLAMDINPFQDPDGRKPIAVDTLRRSEPVQPGPLEWTTLTSRRQQAAAKKAKVTETASHPFDPHLAGRDIPNLHGHRMEVVQETLAQIREHEPAHNSLPSPQRRVPIITGNTEVSIQTSTWPQNLTTIDQLSGNNSKGRSNITKSPPKVNSHTLRKGGMTEDDWKQATSSKVGCPLAVTDRASMTSNQPLQNPAD